MLIKILDEYPGINPDDLTADMINSFLAKEAGQETDTTAESSIVEQASHKDAVIVETAENKKVRGKAECTSAAVEMFNARQLMEELTLQIAQVEEQFGDIDKKFMENLTVLLGGGFKDAQNYKH